MLKFIEDLKDRLKLTENDRDEWILIAEKKEEKNKVLEDIIDSLKDQLYIKSIKIKTLQNSNKKLKEKLKATEYWKLEAEYQAFKNKITEAYMRVNQAYRNFDVELADLDKIIFKR